MADLTKDREESLKLAVDFSDALDDGDSLSSVDAVEITKQAASESSWTDVSTEFGSPTGTISGDTVNVTLGPASGTDQDPAPRYILRVTVSTANGETLIGTPTLDVTAEGDPDAP